MNWSHQPSLIKDQQSGQQSPQQLQLHEVNIEHHLNQDQTEEQVGMANFKITTQDNVKVGGTANVKLFENEHIQLQKNRTASLFQNKNIQILEKQNTLTDNSTRNEGTKSILKKVNFKNENLNLNLSIEESIKNSVEVENEIKNEINQELNKESKLFESNKRGKTFRETMGNIYSNLEKTFDNLSIEESPRESAENRNLFRRKMQDALVHSDLNNYILRDNQSREKLIKTTRTEVERKDISSSEDSHTSDARPNRLYYNQKTYKGDLRMRSPDLLNHLHNGKRSRKVLQKEDPQVMYKKTFNNKFVNVEDEQKTIEKLQKQFSPKKMIQTFSRTPKQFVHTQKIWSPNMRHSPKIKSSRVLPNLPNMNEHKLTQSFYEFPVNNQQHSMIIDRSHDWGNRNNLAQGEYVNMSGFHDPNNRRNVYLGLNTRHQGQHASHHRGSPQQFYHQGYGNRVTRTMDGGCNQGEQQNLVDSQIGMMDVTQKYANKNKKEHVLDSQFRNQFIRMDTQTLNQQNHLTHSEMETHLAMLFKKIIVFSSKIDSLKKKIVKRNPDFSCLNIFQTFCEKKSKRITLEGLKDFFQTFGFDFSSQFLLRVVVYLSAYRINLDSLGRPRLY
jgi:hypothetical protein